jgi:hypothetical protein
MFGTRLDKLILQRTWSTYLFVSIPLGIYAATLYRPARDDWNNWANLRDIPLRFSSIPNIVKNEWCCDHEKRTFFFSWMIQWPITHLGDFAIPLLTLLIFSIIIANGLLAVILSRRFLNSQFSILLGLFIAFGPASIVVGGWANNLFFILPVLFGLLFTTVAFFNSEKCFLLLYPLGALTVFSGETGVPILGMASVFILIFYKGRRKKIIVLSSLFTTCLMLFVHQSIAAGPSKAINFDYRLIISYARSFADQELRIWKITSTIYRPHISSTEMMFAAVVIFFILMLLLQRKQRTSKSLVRPLASLWAWILVPVLISASLFGPIVGALTGVRPGPDLRYHYLSALVLSLILLTVCSALKPLIRQAFVVIATIYLVVGFVQSVGVRSNQGSIDSEVWEHIESSFGFDSKYIVTVAPDTNYPMPPYFSFAESDFQADWGIAGYLRWTYRKQVQVFSRIECNGLTCIGLGYYGTNVDIGNDAKNHSVFIVTTAPIAPTELDAADFYVTDDFDEYSELINQLNL